MSRYKFKGYTITNCGYHQPDHCVWWEAVNENGEACFHGNTLREVEFMILDYEWEQKMKKKDEEIEKLKREKTEAEADALAVGGVVEAARNAEKSSEVGNVAAMREALESCLDFIMRLDRAFNPLMQNLLEDAIAKANTALAAPPRNCDLYATRPEMSMAYETYRKSAMKRYGNGLTGRIPTVKQKPMTYDEWMLAPAAERKGKAK